MGAVALFALSALGGCATGSTASFTMAPLIFAEQADASGDPVPAAATSGDDPALAPYGTFDQGIGHYVAIGGNAVLPVNALLPPGLVIAAGGAPGALGRPGAGAVLQFAPATVTASAGGSGITLAASQTPPASFDATLLGSTVAAARGGSAMPGGTALAGLTVQPAAEGKGLQTQASVATAPVNVTATISVAAAPVAAVSQALIVSKPMLSGAAAPPVGSGTTNLLTASASNMVRMCLLKGCR